MATKPQAKTAIDNAATAIKSDIDNTIPSGVNIVDGMITFSPTKWLITFTVANSTEAETLITGITANLTATSRSYTIDRRRRAEADNAPPGQKSMTIITALANYRIIGF
jgi:hypothetical protein